MKSKPSYQVRVQYLYSEKARRVGRSILCPPDGDYLLADLLHQCPEPILDTADHGRQKTKPMSMH